ncbi:hypothetical protein NIES2135_64070 (plasmid) [Leptolyngbya boryana NIES-2135]|uniref:Uncharacterized protein n=1 Tax=Leptolyngbya boryana NIES-2135 TaxID=1973484 RepID=A0A1Z4JS42_LEPBY|nr:MULTISPECIES: hypothetical protein [Leptolyngbya]BAY59530.1 hypothetical protein NIES2135_64070 [Leptolyngbya boryana NIES-2135]MBD2371288.1 hypothetical protein [Leptolyngbya sp. FACHB-161]MBD2377766.1 hypothetical protein [Leptolyngbya sp. FACHB-238]MBD2402204.1 hypothetical protein [Leptolyngbya sp. FACHB-239]MBD2408697.1 hypothetical protein [Leptolyngbya sp. FACHB-402]
MTRALSPRMALLTISVIAGIYLSYLQDGFVQPLGQAQDVLNFVILVNKTIGPQNKIGESKGKE